MSLIVRRDKGSGRCFHLWEFFIYVKEGVTIGDIFRLNGKKVPFKNFINQNE